MTSAPTQATKLDPERLRQYLVSTAPTLFSPVQLSSSTGSASEKLDWTAAQRHFFNTQLFATVTGVSETKVEQTWDYVSTQTRTPSVCGHVFAPDEPMYQCLDCQRDMTCVLCVDCFRLSHHRDHSYRLAVSGGGGCCDCGDPEAWTSEAGCSKHTARADEAHGDVDLDALPPQWVDNWRVAIQVVSDYIVACIHDDVVSDPPRWMLVDNPGDPAAAVSDQYAVVVFNDEVHTFDEVIDRFTHGTGCSVPTAVQWAHVVDKEGRATIAIERSRAKSDEIASVVAARTPHLPLDSGLFGEGELTEPLRVSVMPTRVMMHQAMAVELISWLSDLASRQDVFRRLLCHAFVRPCDAPLTYNPDVQVETDNELALDVAIHGSPDAERQGALRAARAARETHACLLERFLLSDARIWKTVRARLHTLYMASFMIDPLYKARFAMLFTRNYRRIYDEFARDTHEASDSVIAVTVQLFTVPSLVHELNKSWGLLRRVSFSLLNIFLANYTESTAQPDSHRSARVDLSCESLNDHISNRRYRHQLTDLMYLLRHTSQPVSAAVEWETSPQVAFGYFLALFHNMDFVSRKTGAHVEYESDDWKTAFTLLLHTSPLSPLFAIYTAAAGVESITYAVDSVVSRIRERMVLSQSPDGLFWSETTSNPKFDVLSDRVSVHIPLHRFLACLIESAFVRHPDLTFAQFGNSFNTGSLVPRALMEHPARIMAFVAHQRTGLWVRNGLSVANVVYNYTFVTCAIHTFNRDLFILQICAACMNSGEFVGTLIDLFQLNQMRQFAHDFYSSVLEDLLSLLIQITSERYRLCVSSTVTLESIALREVTHRLLTAPTQTYSSLRQNISPDIVSNDLLESTLAQCASYRRPEASSDGVYTAHDNLLAQFNPYFIHYPRSDRQLAKQHVCSLLEKKSSSSSSSSSSATTTSKSDASYVPMPLPPPLHANFARLDQVLVCKQTLQLIHEPILLSTTAAAAAASAANEQPKKEEKKSTVSDACVSAALDAVALGALIDEREHTGFVQQVCDTQLKPSLFASIVTLADAPASPDRLAAHAKYVVNLLLRAGGSVAQTAIGPLRVAAADAGPSEEDKAAEKKRKQDMARLRREKALKMMQTAQNKFIAEVESGSPSAGDDSSSAAAATLGGKSASTTTTATSNVSTPSSVGRERTSSSLSGFTLDDENMHEDDVCILCQTDEPDDVIGVLASCQVSSVLSTIARRRYMPQAESLAFAVPEYDEKFEQRHQLETRAVAGGSNVYFGSCGHCVHKQCWAKSSATRRLRHACPMCKTPVSLVVPVLPAHTPSHGSSTVWTGDAPATASELPTWIASQLHIDAPLVLPSRLTGDDAAIDVALFSALGKPSQLPKICAYTLASLESEQRLLVRSRHVRPQRLSFLRHLLLVVSEIRALAILKEPQLNTSSLAEFFVKFISPVQCFPQSDPFKLLVSTVVVTRFHPSTSAGSLSAHQFRVCATFCASMVVLQAVFGAMVLDERALPDDAAPVDDDDDAIVRRQMNGLAAFVEAHAAEFTSVAAGGVTAEVSSRRLKCVVNCVRRALLVFLRRSALLAVVLFAEESLFADWTSTQIKPLYANVCLPSLLESSSLRDHFFPPGVTHDLSSVVAFLPAPMLPPHVDGFSALIPLPLNYDTFLLDASATSRVRCTVCRQSDPALCLLCGAFVKVRCCQQRGDLFTHAQQCSRSACIFLLVKSAVIVYLDSHNRTGFRSHAPYLDAHGEPDNGLRRGVRLKLNADRYAKLNDDYISHDLCRIIEDRRSAVPAVEWETL